MILLVLAVLWAGVLVFWLRSRNQGQGAFADSVGTFHRHLRSIERTAPVAIPPANRLRSVTSSSPSPPSQRRYPTASPTIPMARPVGARPPAAGRVAPPPGLARRREQRRRRRDVLFGLTVAFVVTLLLAVATGSSAMLYLQLLSDAALASYVALLVRLRNLATERDMKLRVLQRPVRPGARAGYGELTLRQVAN